MDNREKELIRKAKRGDDVSFTILIEQCKTKAYNIALRYMRNEQDALDALQESFIKIFRYLEKFNEESKFDTWVYRIVVNTCMDMLRKNNKLMTESLHASDGEEEYTVEIADSQPTPWEALEQKEKAEFVLACLNLLGQEQREILILRDVQGFSYDEISDILQCSLGTIKSRINRARKRLKEIILEQNRKDYV